MKTRYSKYKPSGVEWIGEIPDHWKVLRNKYFTIPRQEKSEDGSEVLLSVSEYHGVIPRKSIREGEEHLTRSETLEGYLKVYQNDLVSNIMLMWKRGLGVSEYEGIVSPSYSVFSFKSICIPKYFHYLFRTDQYITEFRKNSTGVIESRLRLYDDEFGSLYSHFPPLPEQEQIVKYLDEKTGEIDNLISITENKIELLKENRTSTINRVITKGLDPNVELKDSGIEWIGDIPKHWEVSKMKYLCKIVYGISPPDTTYNDEGIGIELINGPVEYSEKDFGLTRSLKWTTQPTKIVPEGSLLFCLRGSTTGRLNITHKEVSIGRGVCSLNSKENQSYLVYVVQSLRHFLSESFSGSTFPSVTKDDVDNYVLPHPPVIEQSEIVKHLDQITQDIDTLISIEQQRIETLKEYRQSLISEVITGKVRVCEEVKQ
jgi:type I restriction enzyme S subunit